ncbi:MAG TPA: 4-hydroxy-tetrahydrodipicolinate reductase [Nitrospirae bacterium]|nr:4-hydroxy-tetrahydrodipicolinate reductase [bacterium BMS3Abin09]GBE40644.1 4-hydroxy-tetrahydrodipicolinate reductase [bacterium BMS3Bbin09]HDN94889.1 4-hydroxy-tetrahydrodipicolinate reductase [Nitrospirota bacterium]HDZ84604.1 4-hydroxy-tetrahydrodipicolinate reductase [Nitrospirota bacterium]
MLNITVSGATGRMGTRIITLLLNIEDLKLANALERQGHKNLGRDIGEVIGAGTLGVKITDDIKTIAGSSDVIIDFSSPSATIEGLKSISGNPVPVVIGTTGFSKDEIEYIRLYAQNTPVVFAPNMSVGVNLLLKVLADIAKVTGEDYDVEIVEAHHRLKKDAPSGTAMKMAQVLAAALGRNLDEDAVYARHGLIGERTRKEIGIQTIRAGDIVGEHTVYFGGLGERIEITHKASSRDTFARGALKAAQWVYKQTPGLYDMQDVLGLK